LTTQKVVLCIRFRFGRGAVAAHGGRLASSHMKASLIG
jgi:hypothetical protein